MDYCESGDLKHYITKNFYNIKWWDKLVILNKIIEGLKHIHDKKIIHRDFHSGNILCCGFNNALIGDLGISKSSTESTNDDDGIYGIIPYVAPEIFQEMWELMTGRRPFWNLDHDVDLIIEICDGLRPPIITNAPKGYIELMQKCWHSDPNKRPTSDCLKERIDNMANIEFNYLYDGGINATKIVTSSDIGPVTTNNSGAVYKSRPLSDMIKSAMLARNSRSQSNTSELGNYNVNCLFTFFF